MKSTIYRSILLGLFLSLLHQASPLFGMRKAIRAVATEDIATLSQCLEEGLIIDSRHLRVQKGLLHYAAKTNKPTVILFLIERGANIEIEDNLERTPLYFAAEEGHENAVRTLLDKGATVRTQTLGGDTALHAASSQGSTIIVQMLIKKGASLDAQNNQNETPLHSAVRWNHYPQQVIEILLSHKANVNAEDEDCCTPLHIAVGEKQIGTSLLLLTKGANVMATCTDNKTPLHLCARYGCPGIALILIFHKAKLNAKDSNNQTPLQIALKKISKINPKKSFERHITYVKLIHLFKSYMGLEKMKLSGKVKNRNYCDIIVKTTERE